MAPFPPMRFPGGVMFTVLRPPDEYDVHGDALFVPAHQIGPCGFSPVANKMARGHEGHHDLRDRIEIDINAPVGSDVRKTDRLQAPAGVLLAGTTPLVLHILAEPEHPANGLTGWRPFVHILATLYS